jgi:hypothetical protein
MNAEWDHQSKQLADLMAEGNDLADNQMGQLSQAVANVDDEASLLSHQTQAHVKDSKGTTVALGEMVKGAARNDMVETGRATNAKGAEATNQNDRDLAKESGIQDCVNTAADQTLEALQRSQEQMDLVAGEWSRDLSVKPGKVADVQSLMPMTIQLPEYEYLAQHAEMGAPPAGAIVAGPTIRTRIRLSGDKDDTIGVFRPSWNPLKTKLGENVIAWYSQSDRQKRVFEAYPEGSDIYTHGRRKEKYVIDFQLAEHWEIAVKLGGRPKHGDSGPVDDMPLFYVNIFKYRELTERDFYRWRNVMHKPNVFERVFGERKDRDNFELFGARRTYDQLTLVVDGREYLYRLPLFKWKYQEGFICNREAYTLEVKPGKSLIIEALRASGL